LNNGEFDTAQQFDSLNVDANMGSPNNRKDVSHRSSMISQDPQRDHMLSELQTINLKLRNKIKDLNIVVEKALEKQTFKAGMS